jgi:hypothetical protein
MEEAKLWLGHNHADACLASHRWRPRLNHRMMVLKHGAIRMTETCAVRFAAEADGVRN